MPGYRNKRGRRKKKWCPNDDADADLIGTDATGSDGIEVGGRTTELPTLLRNQQFPVRVREVCDLR